MVEEHVLVGGGRVCDRRARYEAPHAVVHALMKSIWAETAELAACSGVVCWLAICSGHEGAS